MKKKLIFILSPILVIFIIYLGIFTVEKIQFSSQNQDEIIKTFFKDNFSKSVAFDHISFTFLGNVHLYNFKLSAEDDFNNNKPLIFAEDLIIDLDYFSLFKKNNQVRGVHFKNGEFSFYKESGVSFKEKVKIVFLPFFKYRNSHEFVKECQISVDNFVVSYKEVFKNGVVVFDIDKFKFSGSLSNELFVYKANGAVLNKNNEEGKINLTGSFFKHDGQTLSKNNIVLDKMEVSFLNEYLHNYWGLKLETNGLFSNNIFIKQENKNIFFAGKAHLSNLKIHLNESEYAENGYNLVENENFDLSYEFLSEDKFKTWKMDRLDFRDMALNCSFKAAKTENDIYFLKWNIPTANLEKLSYVFQPLPGITYSGDFFSNGEFFIRKKFKDVLKNKMVVNFNNLKIEKNYRGNKSNICDSLNCQFNIDNSIVDYLIKFKRNESNLQLEGNGVINKWFKFSSDFHHKWYATSLNADSLVSVSKFFLEKFYNQAYLDSNLGYNEIYFRQRPFGQWVNRNSFTCSFEITEIRFGEKAKLNDFYLQSQLNNGIFKANLLSNEGYDAKYKLEINSALRRDYPDFKVNAYINKFNLGNFMTDYGTNGKISGLLSFNFDYKTTFYRIGHFLSNGNFILDLNFKDLNLENTNLQKNLISFIEKNALGSADLQKITHGNGGFIFRQLGPNFYFRNVVFAADNLFISGYGNYSISSRKINFPLNVRLNLLADSGQIKKTGIPFIIFGPLFSPKLKIKNMENELNLKSSL